MKKKRLPKPSEVVLPELTDDKRIRGKRTIKYNCPDCNVGDEFRIQQIVFKSRSVGPTVMKSGRYRCECITCGYQMVITSKNPLY